MAGAFSSGDMKTYLAALFSRLIELPVQEIGETV
jgi:hypothetical protein